MLKKTYILEKSVKFVSTWGAPHPNPHMSPAAGGSALRPPLCYSQLLLQLCRVRYKR